MTNMRPLSRLGGSIALAVWLLAILTPVWAEIVPDGSYTQVTGPCNLQFPRDHGPHPGYRTEWWYYTSNLRSETGKRFGFQLTFFRSQLSPPGGERSWPKPRPSAWRTQQLFLAHAALTDISGSRFYHAEQMSRGALDLAGAEQDASGVTRVWVKNWSVRLGELTHFLSAEASGLDEGNGFGLNLNLVPLKSPVAHGEGGYSLKGGAPERASCYYSLTRLEAQGALRVKGREIPVSGMAWMDHEFSSAPLEPGLAGWDWLSLQLLNGSELMIYLLRRQDGTYIPASAGTYVDAAGAVSHLASEDFSLEVLDRWTSPHSGGRYPSRWRVRVPGPDLDLLVQPSFPDQEMQTPGSTGVTYWEGSVSVSGTARGNGIEGAGYVELTGYASPLDAPL